MMRVSLVVLVAAVVLSVPAAAQDQGGYTFKTGRELLHAPQKYVDQMVTITDGYCVYDEPNVVCFGNETPFEVKADGILDGNALAALKDQCGGDLPGKEHDPATQCRTSFSFVPTSAKIGVGDYVLHDIVQSHRRLVLFEANLIELRK